MKKGVQVPLLLALAGLMTVGIGIGCWLLFPCIVGLSGDWAPPCPPPPEGFSKADLVGTWEAGVPDQRDTLVIREDGTYKQSIHIEFTSLPPLDYESDWQPWWLEERENGIPYLHLEGMRLCAFNPGLSCDQAGGDGHDFCRNEQIRMENEGILLVMGVPKPRINLYGGTDAPRGISLIFPAGSENSWAYDLKEP